MIAVCIIIPRAGCMEDGAGRIGKALGIDTDSCVQIRTVASTGMSTLLVPCLLICPQTGATLVSVFHPFKTCSDRK